MGISPPHGAFESEDYCVTFGFQGNIFSCATDEMYLVNVPNRKNAERNGAGFFNNWSEN